MEKKIKSLQTCIAVLLIALVWSVARINSLQSDIKMLQRDLDRELSVIDTRISSIYADVEDILKQEASLLSGSTYTYGDLNTTTSKADIHLTVTPKELREDLVVSACFEDTTVELIRNGNAFTGTIPVGLFADDEQILLTMETPEGIQTEYLEDIRLRYLFPQYLPTFYDCNMSGKNTFHSTGKYTMDCTLNINCSPTEETPDVRFTSFQLITELNGKEIEREDITKAVLGYESYPHGVYFRDSYQRSFDVVEGDELIIWLEAEDSLGYRHRCIVHRWKQEGRAVAEPAYRGEIIYDSEGNLLYGKDFM